MDKHHQHIGFYGAIAGSLIISLLGTYLIVQNQQVEQVGGRENYKMYQKMVKNPKYADNIKQSLEAQIKQMEGGTDDTAAAKDKTTAPEQNPTVSLDTIKGLFNDKNIHFGSANSKLLLVEISDPSCPYCHIAGGHNGALNKQAGPQFLLKADGGTYVAPGNEFEKLAKSGKASFVFLYSNGHGNGELAAQALYCAFEKNKFWEASDLLMSAAGFELVNNVVKNDKTQIGKLADFLKPAVDVKSCLESGKYVSKLSEDQQTATSLGSRGTPGFFVNAQNFSGARNFTDMEASVTAALK
ncbi:MAG: thioredoxin domain-containing protein [bacterium]